jgi:serine/threonine protein kinase
MGKSKPYGDRWKRVKEFGGLGGGAQGDVLRVVDVSGKLAGDYALKKLRDVTRLDRFRNELEALKRLNHPHVVKVIDHSDLSDVSPGQTHYLVMPIALEGDAEKRLPLFKGNIENVVRVAIQLASALGAAHRAGVVHRDVKPGNVLFPNQGLDIWLSDFGICHIEKEVRDTPPGAIMGPRRFAAPEIEAGSTAEVADDIDVYSPGQLIFYLISGGRTFHRENVYATEYDVLVKGNARTFCETCSPGWSPIVCSE